MKCTKCGNDLSGYTIKYCECRFSCAICGATSHTTQEHSNDILKNKEMTRK